MKIKFIRPVQGFAYFENDVTSSLPDERAAYLVSIGAAFIIPETEGKANNLPPDMPARVKLFEAGFETIDDVRNAAGSLTDIPGITRAIAAKIIGFLSSIQNPISSI